MKLLTLTLWTLVATALLVAAAAGQDIINTPHNLSVTGPGPVTSTQSQVCIFCHAPHNVRPDVKPLWNHQLSIQSYTAYSSSTMAATSQQPSSTSKLCLSCHDGSVALGQTIANSTLIPTSGALSSSTNLGTDLRNDHPVSFTLANKADLAASLFQNPPKTLDPKVQLKQGKVECTSCHEPHRVDLDPVARNFLVRSNSNSALCLACHDPSRPQPNNLNGWSGGAHQTASNATTGAQTGEYGNVAANACLSCHQPHNQPTAAPSRLLRGVEEATCASCHSGTNLSPAIANIVNEFTKTYSHPTTKVTGLHDAAENAFPLNGNRHAECADCHNPHAASSASGSSLAPALQPALLGASGVDRTTGVTALRPASNEFEVCFKCHANSGNKPQGTAGFSTFGRTPVRQTFSTVADPYNTRLEFNTALARHPVTQARYKTNAQLPSLRANMLNLDNSPGRSLAPGTSLYCTDCHANDAARASKGTGPNGPHGSNWTHLLERRYDLEPSGGGGVSYVAGISGTAGLCFKCHDVDGIVNNTSFKGHRFHVSGERASCATCHASHGIQGGTTTNNPNLINFDTTIVSPSSSGRLQYTNNGGFSGTCYLRCHGQDHNPKSF